MIIYLEGADASGKSTLKGILAKRLEQLKNIRNVKVVPDGELLIPTRPGNPNRLTAAALVNQMWQMANDITTVYICDRGPISDIIYRAFDEFKPVLNLETYWTMWLANQHFIVTIHCDTDLSEEMLRNRGDNNPIAVANHKALRYLYKQLMPMFGALKYDISTINTPDERLHATNTILARLWTGIDNYTQIKNIIKKI